MKSREFQKWLVQWVKLLRARFNSLPEEERDTYILKELCISPLQISALWIETFKGFERQEIQYYLLVFISHISDRSDLEIDAYVGTEIISSDSNFDWLKKINISSAIQGVKGIVDSNKWNFLYNGKNFFKAIVENWIVRFFQDPRIISKDMSPLSLNTEPPIFVWSWNLNLHNNPTPEDWLRKNNFYWFPSERRTKENVEKSGYIEAHQEIASSSLQSRENTTVVHSTYFYPPIWIGAVPQFKLIEKVTNTPIVQPKKALEVKYKEYRIFVREDGKIMIETNDRYKALDCFNEIFATAFYLSDSILNFYPIKEFDLGGENINSESLQGMQGYCPWRLRSELFNKLNYSYDDFFPYPSLVIRREKFNVVPAKTVEYFIMTSEKLSKQTILVQSLRSLHMSKVLLDEFDFLHSVILAWECVDFALGGQVYDSQLEKVVKNRAFTKEQTNIIADARKLVDDIQHTQRKGVVICVDPKHAQKIYEIGHYLIFLEVNNFLKEEGYT
ncbi:hypothetical protein KAX35_07590 [candidate division WOR-3 bacterium]|nr:hypothetical protein [candidate division WOR-3 bacterium]